MAEPATPARTHGLVCIGNLTVDESIQPDGRRTEALGGDAVFAVLAARLAGGDATWLAPLGNDLPTGMAAALRGAGLSLDQPRRDRPTVRNVIHYDADGGRRWEMQCSEDDFDCLSVYPGDVRPDVLGARALVLLAMSLGAQLALTPWLRAHSGAQLYLDLQEDYVTGNERELAEIVAVCDVFLPSEVEATRLARTGDLETAARRFAASGPRVVVIKRAGRGCLVLDAGRFTEVPAEVTTAVDPTGAGDAFCGAFAAAHLATGDAVSAARTASRVAALAIGAPGVTALLAAGTSP